MESLAQLSGDVEALVAVKSRDLSSAYDYLHIAEIYREAGERGQALAWAEKGMQAFPERQDSRLLTFAADEYHHRLLHDQAMALIWKLYLEWPTLANFALLECHAEKAHAWPEWRERALSELRRRIEKSGRNDRSPLIEIFLYEKNVEEAWREAQGGDCWENLQLRLADLRSEEHPGDAGAIFWNAAERELASVRNSRYEHAVDLLVKAAAAMKRAGQSVEFRQKLELLKWKYGAKRNFMRLLEEERRLLYL
jgi:tetratricopeptide (TPR) repeat protein